MIIIELNKHQQQFRPPLEAKQTVQGHRGGILAVEVAERRTAEKNYHRMTILVLIVIMWQIKPA